MSKTFYRFKTSTKQTFTRTLGGCLRAVKTVIWTPQHDDRIIHQGLNKKLTKTNQPLNPACSQVVADIQDSLEKFSISRPKYKMLSAN
ncbi:hypothetical protein CSA80_04770 [Candidatus Saccharibacteria bacterium]|nr:MAG: hypothetical protein CSA80_04770 [Candidatus Saccharibacteria bacterium]